MVDKRPFPAESPAAFKTFAEWLDAAVRVHSFQARVAEYTDASPQNVQKWLDGSIPKNPKTHRLIAEWARVDYNDLRDLIDKTQENRPLPKAQGARKLAPKTRLLPRA